MVSCIDTMILNKMNYDVMCNKIDILYTMNNNNTFSALNEINKYFINTLILPAVVPHNEFVFRYGQKEAYDKFNTMICENTYWGLMIAPTGWGKTMMHYLFMGSFFKK